MTRLGVTATVAGLVAVTGIIAAVAAAHPAGARSAGARPAAGAAQAPATGAAQVLAARANAAPAVTIRPPAPASTASAAGVPSETAASAPARATAPLVLTAADHRDCPAAATSGVDLARHITWLQAKGKITFGPVQMEPGKPGSKHQTPRGKFWVQWKAGPSFVSNIYHEPMPWATFFAAGGIAFHGGSLTAWSHGCVHLTDSNAHYYNVHLPVGAEVVVF
jgi:lipoprotein-anchoring transpeptidase ErfK/SrfK